MKKILTFVAAVLMAASAAAIPPLHVPYAIPDGNGSTVMLYKHGDMGLEFYTTLDDRIVIRNADGRLVYALEQDGRLVASEVCVHDIARRSDAELNFAHNGALSPAAYGMARRAAQATAARRSPAAPHRAYSSNTADGLGKYGVSALGAQPSVGKFHIPVVMVEFADMKFKETTTMEYMSRFYNEEGFKDIPNVRYHLYGSVRDYFLDQSHGLFDPTFDVVAKVTLDNSYAYYGQNDPASGGDKNVRKLVREAILLAQEQGVDFMQYVDATKQNVPLVSFLYAGEGEATGGGENTIWPHQSGLSGVNIGGVRFGSYFVGNELNGDDIMGMGVFIHEFCHGLGLPDFYDSTYSYKGNDPFGYWSVLDGGAYNEGSYSPSRMTAYERSYLGWLKIPELKDTKAVTLSNPDADYNNSLFLFRQPNSVKDYFIFENVNDGKWAPMGSGSGLLVTRFHYDKEGWEYNSVNNRENKKMAMVVTASGEKISNGTPRPTHLYGTGVFDIPELPRWDGRAETSHPIYQIARHEDGTVTLSAGERNLYSTIVSDGRLYRRVDNAAELASGDSVIFVSNAEAQAMSVYNTGTARAVTPIKVRDDGGVEGNPEVLILRAVKTKDGSKWGFSYKVNNTNNYLAASSSGGLTSVTKTGDNCLGTLDVVDGNAIVKFGGATRSTLTYYTDNTRITCSDGSLPSGLSIYRLTDYVSGIDNVEVDATSAPAAVYTLSGRYVGNSLDALPSGVYVVNGKKIMR